MTQKDLLNLAKSAAVSAGAEIMKHYDKFDIFSKADKSPVTTADLAANDKIFQILSKSEIPICSEENITKEHSDTFWLVDPLDGTKEFIEKNGEFCVCIALIRNQRPIIGVIFIPCTNELFYADENGAFKETLGKNAIKLPNSNQKNLYISRRGKSQISKSLAFKFGFEIKKLGSAIKFCRLAELGGIYIRLSPSYIWDNAAGDAILSFCGGDMFNTPTKSKPKYSLDNLKSSHFVSISSKFLHLKEQIQLALDYK